MIPPRWISTWFGLGLKRNTIRSRGNIKRRPWLLEINEVIAPFSLLFISLTESSRSLFKMSSSNLFEKVGVAEPFQAVIQRFFPPGDI